MILVVSPARTVTEVSALLDPIAPLQDDDVSKELLDEPSVSLESLEASAGTVPAEEDCTKPAELDSSTGAELLLSSPQATSPMAMQASIAGNANRFILTS